MRCRWLGLAFILVSVYLHSQMIGAQAGPTSQGKSAAPSTSSVPPDAAVVTIDGLCEDSWLSGLTIKSQIPPISVANSTGTTTSSPGTETAKSDKDCKTVITRAEWEKFSDAVQPPGGPQGRIPAPENSRLVRRYADLLLYARRARELGIDKDPDVQEEMRFSMLQVLSGALVRKFRLQAEDISDSEVAKVYKEHPDLFNQVDLERIYIPKTKQHTPDASLTNVSKTNPAADEAEMRAVADKIQKEAAAGGDFQKLEDEAYKAAGVDESPSVEMGMLSRAIVPAEYKDVIFSLKVNQVSPVEPSTNGWHIFKVTHKEIVPLDHARSIIVSERLADIVDPFRASIKVQTNDDYFQKSMEPH